MWKRNFLFRADEAVPLPQTENELFHETDPALDSSGLQMDTYISVWLQGEGDERSHASRPKPSGSPRGRRLPVRSAA